MLKSIQIDGLRSLCDFKLDLKPGLNVLVGPNGSGKTNILTAFELISRIHRLDSHSDERGFYQDTEICDFFDVRRKRKKIKLTLIGELEGEFPDFESVQENFSGLQYKYECEIVSQPDHPLRVLFSKQLLEVTTIGAQEGDKHMCLEYVNNVLRPEINRDFLNSDIPKDNFEPILKIREKSLSNISLMHQYSIEIVVMRFILQDISTEPCFNIDPKSVRYNMELTRSEFISPTGVGLLSTLLTITNKANNLDKNELTKNGINYIDIYKKIIGYFKLLLPELVDLEVSYNTEKNEIESYAIFEENGGKKDKIPLKLMSDGTLKWLSVITALLTTNRIFLLEEPENFLHPVLQTEFISLTRSMIGFGQNIALISTHSESVLNSLDTSEVVVTTYQKGRTLARRIENAEQVTKRLQESGFGLGWYYTTGSLDIEYEPSQLPLPDEPDKINPANETS